MTNVIFLNTWKVITFQLIFSLLIFAYPSMSVLAQSAQDYYTQGNAKYKSKDFKGALSDYRNALKLNPVYDTAFYRVGYLNFKVAKIGYKKQKISYGDYKKILSSAINNFTKAIGLNDKYFKAYHERAKAQVEY